MRHTSLLESSTAAAAVAESAAVRASSFRGCATTNERQLSMSQRSNGVFINDPKGLFILRWYREVKGDGTPPDGPRYQNRACKYYKLTSDNDGEAFRWTSNYQIISKVYLKKHSTLPLCYSLSAADKKMVTSTMKKMVGRRQSRD